MDGRLKDHVGPQLGESPLHVGDLVAGTRQQDPNTQQRLHGGNDFKRNAGSPQNFDFSGSAGEAI